MRVINLRDLVGLCSPRAWIARATTSPTIVTTAAEVRTAHASSALARLVEPLAGLVDRHDLRRAGDELTGVRANPIDELLALVTDALDRGPHVVE
jgi:hypothetical protein